MVETTYFKELHDEKDRAIISFEGDIMDIYELRDYARIINSTKRKIENEYYYGLKNNKEEHEKNYGKADYEATEKSSFEVDVNELAELYMKTLNTMIDCMKDEANDDDEECIDERCDKDACCNENELCDIVSDIMEEEAEDLVNHPSHYTNSGMECIDEMILLYGEEEVMSFCKLNAHKYRKRALDKGGKQDMEKSDWYLAKYKELKDIVNKHDVLQYRTFLNDMEILLKQGASLDISDENFIRLYENFLV